MWLGWWVPLVNLWFLFQVLRDVRESSSPVHPPRALVGPWWAAFLALVVLDQVVTQMTSSSSPLTQEGADRILYGQLAAAAAALVAGVLWIGLVREITDNQTEESPAVGNLPQPLAAVQSSRLRRRGPRAPR